MATGYTSAYIPLHVRSPHCTDKSLFLNDNENQDDLNITLRKPLKQLVLPDTEISETDPPLPTPYNMFDTLNNKMSDQVDRLKRIEVSNVNTNKALQYIQDTLNELKAKVVTLENENKNLKKQNAEYHSLSRDLDRRVNTPITKLPCIRNRVHPKNK